jgi:hypothetical protein
LERLLHNWDALKVYIKEEKDKQDIKKTRKKKSSNTTPRIDKSFSTVGNMSSGPTTSSKSTGSKPSAPTSNSTGNKTILNTVDGSEQSSDTHETYAEKKVNAIYDFMRSPTNKLYAIFLCYTVNVFDEVLLGLQAEDPKVHVLRRMLHKMIRQILNRFVKPSAMIGKSVDEVQYKLSYNIKPTKIL